MQSPNRDITKADAGFTIVEVMIALFILAIIAVMVFPAFAGALKQSSRNTTLATAAQLAGQQIDDARSRTATCSALQAWSIETIAPVVDSRSVSFQPSRSSITCPVTYPGVATVSVSVTLTGKTSVLASATTYLLLTAAS